MAEKHDDIMVATRVSKSVHEKLLRRQRELKRLTGIAPSVSAIVRALIVEAVTQDDKKPKHGSAA